MASCSRWWLGPIFIVDPLWSPGLQSTVQYNRMLELAIILSGVGKENNNYLDNLSFKMRYSAKIMSLSCLVQMIISFIW